MLNETSQVSSISGGTDIIAIIVLSVIALLLLVGVITIIIILRNRYIRNSVRFNVLMPDGKKVSKRFKNVTGKETIDDCVYTYDAECEVKNKWGKEIYFTYNNPKPLDFRKAQHELKYSGKNIKALMDSTMVDKLMGETNISREEMFIIGLIILNLISLFFLWKGLGQGVSVADTPENVNIIAKACLQGLKGGL